MTSETTEDLRARQGRVCKDWWKDLHPSPDTGAMRQARAQLRRIRAPISANGRALDVVAAWEVAAFRDLKAGLDQACPELNAFSDWRIKAQVVCAAVLAHVRDDLGTIATAKALGAGEHGPVMAESRFKRLLRQGHDDIAELLDPMIQAVHLLGNAAPVADLAVSLLDWTPRRRLRWAQAYWTQPATAEAPHAPTL